MDDMPKPGHNIVVKVGLTADQYLALKHLAGEHDVPHSIFMRHLLIQKIRECAHDDVNGCHDAMPGTGLIEAD